jgi:uncharacterized membrane protein
LSHWEAHPHVRTGAQLTFGERAADKLKAAFGSWAFLIILNVLIVAWIAANIILPRTDRWDIYPFILLNLGLSWLAAQQGGALQIAANRGDRIASEVATGTHKNSEELLALNKRQMEILERIQDIDARIEALSARLPASRAAKPQGG